MGKAICALGEGEGPSTRTGGITIIGPVKYPAGPKPRGTGAKSGLPTKGGEKGKPVPGGKPPGLSFPHPVENQEKDPS